MLARISGQQTETENFWISLKNSFNLKSYNIQMILLNVYTLLIFMIYVPFNTFASSYVQFKFHLTNQFSGILVVILY